jgi:hypothetical protein
MRLVKPNYVLSGSVEQASCLGMLDKTLSISCQDLDLSPSDFFEVLFHISSMRGLNIVSHKTPPFHGVTDHRLDSVHPVDAIEHMSVQQRRTGIFVQEKLECSAPPTGV